MSIQLLEESDVTGDAPGMRLLNACPLCGSSALQELYSDARDPHYGIPGEYRMARCASCSLVFVNPMLSDEWLAQLYPADYYAYQESPTASRLKLTVKRLVGYWQGVHDPHFERPGVLLDIGCGSGAYLRQMKDRGWDAHGVEISRAAAESGRRKGLKIFHGTLHEAQFPSAYFDYARASHSLEHITYPHETLEEIRRILKPSGKVLIAVPNFASVTSRIFRQYWWHLCPPVHPFSYSVQSLSTLIREHGFAIEKTVFSSDYVGLLGSLQIWVNRRNGKRSFDGSLFQNRALRVMCQWMERLFDLGHRGDMIEITATIAS